MSRSRRFTYDVCISDFPDYVEEKQITEKFVSFGEISSVYVVNKSSLPKLAYIRFLCEPDADRAVECFKNYVWDDKPIKVKRGQYCRNVKQLPRDTPADIKTMDSNSNSTDSEIQQLMKPEFPMEVREVVCCYVEDPITFYGQKISDVLLLLEMTNNLQIRGPVQPLIKGLPIEGQIYLARFTEDNLWYRCKILQVKDSKSFVFYIDYGNKEYVSNREIAVLPPEISNIPPFSVKYKFHDVNPVSPEKNKSLYDEAVKYLKKLLEGTVKLQIVSYVDDTYFVNKCFWNCKDICVEIMTKGYATYTLSAAPFLSINSSPKFSGRPISKEKNCCSWETGSGNFSATPSLNFSQSFSIQGGSKESSKFNYNQMRNQKPFINGRENGNNKLPGELAIVTAERDSLKQELELERKKFKNMKQMFDVLESKLANNCIDKFDIILSQIKELYSIRYQNTFLNQFDVLEEAYLVWKSDSTVMEGISVSKIASDSVEKSLTFYSQCQTDIGQCIDKSLLPGLIVIRDVARQSLCECLGEYLNTCKTYHINSLPNFEKVISDIEANYQEFLNINMCTERSLDDLIKSCHDEKVKLQNLYEVNQKDTDAALEKVIKILHIFSKALNPDCFFSNSAPFESKGNYQNLEGIQFHEDFKAATLMDDLRNLHECINNEISIRITQKAIDKSLISSLAQSLLRELYKLVNGIKECIQQYEIYYNIHDKLKNLKDIEPCISKLHDIRKCIKTLKSKLRHKLADKKDIEESDEDNEDALKKLNEALNLILHELHMTFAEEDALMTVVVQAYNSHFPELQLLYPELSLSIYSEYNGLLKHNWEFEHFNVKHIPNALEMSYQTKFVDEPVVIKEYLLDGVEAKKLILQKLTKWYSINDVHVLPVQAIFMHKEGRQVFVQFPYIPKMLYECGKIADLKEAYCLLLDVLKGLEQLHSHELVHSYVHPSTILLHEDSNSTLTVLDFCFNIKEKCFEGDYKGITFQSPESLQGITSAAGDMYSFGCLMLWLLLPNLHFHPMENGIPDVDSYKNIIQNLLPTDGFAIIKSLLDVKPSCRPTAKSLLHSNFLQQQILNYSLPKEKFDEPLTILKIDSEQNTLKADNIDINEPVNSVMFGNEDERTNLQMSLVDGCNYYKTCVELNDLHECVRNGYELSNDVATEAGDLLAAANNEKIMTF